MEPERGYAVGKAARKRTPRSAHAAWSPPHDRADPIDILERDNVGRLTNLVPIRFKRMSASSFAFYRGAASIMANDMQSTPNTGITTQICGDAHLANFGAYASPERRLIFDVNDFDETIVGSWEWDLKRLCTRVAVLARSRGFKKRQTMDAVRDCARAYREHMAIYAEMSVLNVWYAHIDESVLEAAAPEGLADVSAALSDPGGASRHLYAKLVDSAAATPKIADHPPLVYHPDDDPGFIERTRAALKGYVRSLPLERRKLADRFSFVDAAYRVVGVGSVGTRCAIAMLVAGVNDPLILQLKEARDSVYARYDTCRSLFKNEGERVVAGQHSMQAATDLFLGWTRANDGHTYYVRQLRDSKLGVDLTSVDSDETAAYAALCAWALARAHAKSGGDPAAIAGYLGASDAFDAAMVSFAIGYAAQNDADYAALLAAIKSGRVTIA